MPLPGTQVLIGGEEYRESNGTLTLKSSNLKLLTTHTGDDFCGRGDQREFRRLWYSLKMPKSKLTVFTFYIPRASLQPNRPMTSFRVSVDIKGLDVDGIEKALTVEDVGETS